MRLRDHLPKIMGKGTYIDDYTPKNTAYLFIVRSPIARGIINSVSKPDKTLLTLTWDDVKVYLPVRADPETMKKGKIVKMPVLADGRVNFVGQPVLAIVVEDRYKGEDIIEEVNLDYQELPPVLDIENAMKGDPIHPGLDKNVSVDKTLEGGQLSAKKEAEVIVSRKIYQNRIVSNPMEPKGVLTYWDGDTLNVYGSFQSVFRIKSDLGESLSLPPEKIKVNSTLVGGGFGNKVPLYAEYILAAIASMKLHRPIKWIETRLEHLRNPTIGRGVLSEVKMYAKKTGEVLGVEGYIAVDLGAYNYTLNPTTPDFIARLVTGPYRMKFASIRALGVFTNLPPTGPYRGAGRPEATLIHETLVEELAKELNMDSVEIRRKNIIGDMEEYITPLGLKVDPAGYKTALNVAESYYRANKEKYKDKGVSIVAFMDIDRLSPGESARVRIENGRVKVFVGTGPHGQAHEDTFAKLVSEVLKINEDLIDVVTNSTDIVKEGIGSFGSRSGTVGGSAVIEACKQLLQKINMPIERALKELNGIEVEVFYKADDIFTPGSHVAVVDVDKETGFVKILKYYAVEDVGRELIKDEVEGQIVGGILQGISQVLWEQTPYDQYGNPLFSSIADCGVPSAVEADYHVELNTLEFPSALPTKSRGVGEAGTTGALPAVFIALEKAIGKKFTKTPVLPWDIIS
ncbi:xanthine dehydrogenase family protein molybdopterin-binding subunit [Acidianus sp. HS-5]|uniref:xanthine dehydrogenase family protein molybdopterin-binding subunit n=1 Tax=Acidianus sp. HS-5 TaxID=2886040 RepID=UPI001F2D2AA6|nr:xanthine dehydrogenase family protein molybdopterin-binding subunit [Acidianus sp. HS-5]BDC18285.1 aldehyde oxidase [Acidianus sp. HS-5]